MKIIKKAILLLCFIGVVSALHGQDYYFSLSYNTAAPFGETKNYVDNFSWRGISAEGQWFLSPQASIGFFFGWNTFVNKLSDSFNDGGTRTVTGTQIRNINAFPMLLEGHYYLGDSYEMRPYVGIGIGSFRTIKRTDMGVFSDESSKWQFGFAPSVGLLVPVNNDVNLNIGIRYNYALETNKAINQNYLGINVGIAWLD